jgi:hypothetical protein
MTICKASMVNAAYERETPKSSPNPFAKYGYFCLEAIFAGFHGLWSKFWEVLERRGRLVEKGVRRREEDG